MLVEEIGCILENHISQKGQQVVTIDKWFLCGKNSRNQVYIPQWDTPKKY